MHNSSINVATIMLYYMHRNYTWLPGNVEMVLRAIFRGHELRSLQIQQRRRPCSLELTALLNVSLSYISSAFLFVSKPVILAVLKYLQFSCSFKKHCPFSLAVFHVWISCLIPFQCQLLFSINCYSMLTFSVMSLTQPLSLILNCNEA